MTLLALDMNASCARAVYGPAGEYPAPWPLEPPSLELPLIISMENSTLDLGRAGLVLSRQMPHVICRDFLPRLGEPYHWKAGRHRLDSAQALHLVWQHLHKTCIWANEVIMTVPAYLPKPQIDQLLRLGEKARFTFQGSLTSTLAAALAGYAQQSWFGSVIVADLDDHALTLAHIRETDGQALVLETRSFPNLSLRVWKERLLNALADCCVWQSRLDPRASPLAEQTLFDHLDLVCKNCARNRSMHIGLQAAHWYQNIIVEPEQTLLFCAGLVDQVSRECQALWLDCPPETKPRAMVITHPLGRLPGLTRALRDLVDEWLSNLPAEVDPQANGEAEEDFGEELLGGWEKSPVVVLSADAIARGGHAVGISWQRGDYPKSHLERMAPLPLPQSVDAGPPRLYFFGQDFFLREGSFTLGHSSNCDLVIDGSRHPTVAGRHCEILLDHRTFLLFDHSREGTWVNDVPVTSSAVLRPGDWIRLGREGPQLRFLGQTSFKIPVPR